MPTLERFYSKDNAFTTCSAIDDTSTTLVVADASKLQDNSHCPFSVTVFDAVTYPDDGTIDPGMEVMKVTAVSGNNLTVVRGFGDNAATEHDAGEKVLMTYTSKMHENMNDNLFTHTHASGDGGLVPLSGIESVSTGMILGRPLTGPGSPLAMTASAVRLVLNVADGANNYVHPNHSGDVTSVGDGAQTIANGAVTLAKQANIPTARIMGRIDAGDGVQQALTVAQTRTALSLDNGINVNTDTVAINRKDLVFDGNEDYVELGAAGAITALTSVSSFTIEGWFKPSNISKLSYLWYSQVDANNRILSYYNNTSDVLLFAVSSGGGYGYISSASSMWTINTWHHVAVVYDGSQSTNATRLVVYIDGVARSLTFNGTIPATSPNLSGVIFRISSLGTEAFQGRIRRFGIYSSALSSTNVLKRYNMQPYSTGRTNYYLLGEQVGSVATDTGSSPVNGTITNATWATAGDENIEIDGVVRAGLGFAVGAAQGITATIVIPPIAPQTVAGSAVFTLGILTAYTAPS